MLFAAGLGTRLRPLTDTMPKALVPIAGKPLLMHVIQKLVHQGATEIVVNVHHFASQIYQHLASHNYGVDIKVSDESNELLDTGGGLKKALKLFTPDERPILIHNVDILSNADLHTFYTTHSTDEVALMVSERNSSRQLLFNNDKQLVGWTNLQTNEVKTPYPMLDVSETLKYAFSGIHLISPTLQKRLTDYPEKFPIMDFYLQQCHKLKIKAYVPDNLRLLDVGKINSLQEAEIFIREQNQL